MAVELTLPKFGLTMHEGTVQRYFKSPGDPVAIGEPIYEVETEKVLQEVEATAAGTFAVAIVEPGATVECGALVAVIAEAGDDLSEITARYGNGAGATGGAGVNATAPPVAPSGASADTAAVAGGAPAEAGRRSASPVARKLAAELGIELAKVAGSGPGGRITREDVERAAFAARAASAAGASAHAHAGTPAQAAHPAPRAVPMRGMRRTIADRMTHSLRESAQLTITTEADVTPAVELRASLSRDFDFTYTDLLIQAAARALVRHPRMNARLAGDAIEMRDEVNVGMAVALDDGLIVPVIHGADRKPVREIAALTRDFGERARSGKLKLEDVSGGTFTITNLGTFGIDAFTPIINPGEIGILGVGRIVEKPAVRGGEIVRRWMMTLSLTFDHRLIDGAPAAAFLRTVIEIFNFGER